MARPKVTIDLETVAKAEEELAEIKDSKLSIQLKAIIAAREHPVENVAKILKISARDFKLQQPLLNEILSSEGVNLLNVLMKMRQENILYNF